MTHIIPPAVNGRCRIVSACTIAQRLRSFVVALVLPVIAAGQSPDARQDFDIPAGDARPALKQFAAQAKREIMFPVESVDGVKTNEVKGQMTSAEAIERMLAGTRLVAVLDEKTGAFAVRVTADSASPPKTQSSPRERRRPVETSAAGPLPSSEEAVILSPFLVNSLADKGYFASSTLSGTRLNTRVEDLAASITVVTHEQLLDMAAVDINDIFLNEANTEGSHQYTSITPSATGVADNTSVSPESANRIRGLGPANIAQNNFTTSGLIPLDSYNIESVEISRGPNSNIFGLGSASGTVNTNTTQANLGRKFNTLTFRADSYGGYRAGFDFNRPLIKDALALRLSGIYDDKGSERRPAVDRTKRLQVALTARPFRSTTVRATYERYDNFDRRANTITPRDFVTSWRDAGSPTWDPTTWTATANGARTVVLPAAEATLLPKGLIALDQFNRPSMFIDQGAVQLFMVNRSATGPSDASPFRVNANERLMQSGTLMPPLYTPPDITNRGLYDWTSTNIAAANWGESQADTFRVELEQSFLRTATQLLAVQAGYYREDYHRYSRYFIGGSVNSGVRIDVNEKLLDGRANPYFLRPYLGGSDNQVFMRDRSSDNFRATVAYKLDFTRSKGIVRWLGSHSVTGYGEYREVEDAPSSLRYQDIILSDHSWLRPGAAGFNRLTFSSNSARPSTRYYLGDAQGSNVDYAPQVPLTLAGNYDLQWFNHRTGSWVSENTTIGETFYALTRNKTENETGGVIWQGSLWKGRIVPTIGWRKDRNRTVNSNPAALDSTTGLLDTGPLSTFRPNWLTVSGVTKTRGVVIKAARWLNLHYNEADSFIPADPRQNVLGNVLPNPSGTGKDYGVTFNLFSGKLVARINKYETFQRNARYNSLIPARAQRLDFDIPGGITSFDLLDAATSWATQQHPQWTPAQQRAEAFRTLGLTEEFVSGIQNGFAHNDTMDTKGKGLELEVNYNPNRSWTLKVTAAQQRAFDYNVSPAGKTYVDSRLPIWTSVKDPNTGVYWWTGTTNPNAAVNNTNTNIPINWYNILFLAPYKLSVASEGKSKPQVREWRFNALTSLKLADLVDNRHLKRVTVGGAVRWEDKGAIGYLASAPDADGVVRELDVNKPVFDQARFHVDLFAAYALRFWDDKIRSRVQLNIRDVLEDGRLQPIAVNPDGQPFAHRIIDPRQFILTVSFDL